MKKEIITIPKLLDQNPVVNYDILREEGLNHILDLGRKLWTDFNSHDPGVTTLEMLSYAISDLGYHINLPMQDLIAEKNDNFSAMHEKFLTALNVLPSCPVTVNDYRKLFINRVEVNNVWVEKGHYELYANCEDKEYQVCKPNNSLHQKICLNGLYKFWVELKDKAIVYPDAEETDWTPEEIDNIKKELKHIYHQNRNLDEDLLDICEVKNYSVKICSNIELTADADIVEVIAQLKYKFKEYFSPSINHYSLREMLGKGYSTDEIFEGTTLKDGTGYLGGFIDDKELNESAIRRDLHVSDLIRIIMNTPGVKVVNDLHMGECNDTDIGGDNKEWSMCIPEGHKPIICEQSVFNFFKDIVPLEQTEDIKKRSNERLYELLSQNIKSTHVETEDISFPIGSHYNLSEYHSIQNHFPDTYGINQIGLPRSVGEERLAMAKQMKGYLLFFDQILANYFAQLNKVKDLLSLNKNLSETYFSQVINDVKDVDKLWVDPINIGTNVNQTLNDLSNNNERTNQLLDHLLARFAVNFNEYSLLMYSITEDSAASTEDIEQTIISNKRNYLNNFQKLSGERGKGFNYCSHDKSIPSSENVSGLEKRIAFLSGQNSPEELSLAHNVNHDSYITDSGKFKFNIIDDDKNKILTSNKKYDTELEAKEDLDLLFSMLENTENIELYEIVGSKTLNNFRLAVWDSKKESIIASSEKYSNQDALVQQEKFIHFLNEKKEDLDQKNVFVVEHLLLRPVPSLTSGCTDENIFCKEQNLQALEAYESALEYYNDALATHNETVAILDPKEEELEQATKDWHEIKVALTHAQENHSEAENLAENTATEAANAIEEAAALAAEAAEAAEAAALAESEGTEEAIEAAAAAKKAAEEAAAVAEAAVDTANNAKEAFAIATNLLNEITDDELQMSENITGLQNSIQSIRDDEAKAKEELAAASKQLQNAQYALGGDIKELPMFSLDNCGDCKSYDPYSFKISVILPGWTSKFVNLDYRKFVEKTIRLETPAHILPKICFISKEQMTAFEHVYQPWLNHKNQNCCKADYRNSVNPYTLNLITILEQLKNHYPDRPILKGCADDEGGHLFLGRTNL